MFNFALVRFNSDGSLDAGFGDAGWVTTDFSGWTDIGRAVTLQEDGKIILAGYSTFGYGGGIALARYNPDGSLDLGFGSGGLVALDNNAGAGAVTLQEDGKIVVAGDIEDYPTEDFALAHFEADGTPDFDFGSGGLVSTDFSGGLDSAHDVALQPDGEIVVVREFDNGANPDIALARYNANGSLDLSFGGGDGKVTTDISAGYDIGEAVALLPDGRIMIAGGSWSITGDITLVCYNEDGSLCTSFGGGDGIAMTDLKR